MKTKVFMVSLSIVFFISLSLVFAEADHAQISEKRLIKIFQKYPERFSSSNKCYLQEGYGGREEDVYNGIKNGLLIPGEPYNLMDGAIAYWTVPNDTLWGIMKKLYGPVSEKELDAEAVRQGLKNRRLETDDILVFTKKTRG